ncbi:Vitamin B12 dependent methionine synthase activation subunit [Drancourtella sp. An210]|nr:Vitamin B12 dependent methionine synthase activation subunit [Drancourtella sp. An210]
MDRKIKEAIRYLGYGSHAIDEKTLAMIESSFEELEKIVRMRFIYRIFELSHEEGNRLRIGQWEIEGKSLSKNMKGCGQVVVFAATLGTEADRLMRRYALTDMAKTVVIQACAAALLEEYCDACQDEISEQMWQEGYYLRPRFSPGYGDFDIRHQERLLGLLDAGKSIGLTMTESCMLVPTKSVTALIGASTTKTACHRQGCEVCEKTDCIYRRDSR